MPTSTWIILVLLLLAVVAYLSFQLGRSMAARQTARLDDPEPGPAVETRREPPRPSAPPPPAMAGEREGTASASAATPRRAAPPPAAAAGPSQGSSGQTASTPKRSAAPPPAQAAWSSDKPGKSK